MVRYAEPGDPILREVMPIFEGDFSLLRGMADQMFAALVVGREGVDGRGVGLAAPQIGQRVRMFVLHVAIGSMLAERLVCVNPRILNSSRLQVSASEGCLSFPHRKAFVRRAKIVTAEWRDLEGMVVRKQLDGLAARAFQHELDHLNGICIVQAQAAA